MKPIERKNLLRQNTRAYDFSRVQNNFVGQRLEKKAPGQVIIPVTTSSFGLVRSGKENQVTSLQTPATRKARSEWVSGQELEHDCRTRGTKNRWGKKRAVWEGGEK